MRGRRGTTMIDLLVSMGILTLLFGAIFLTYYSILGGSANVEERTEASSVINRQLEILRNLPYEKIGTVGGIPSGILSAQQTITFGRHVFDLTTTVRNVDDPFDGTLGGTPNDSAPADYKTVQFDISCRNCQSFRPFGLVSTFAPKNLESASSTGSLFVNVFDAQGEPVSDAVVRVVNSSTVPAIDLTDLTNASGTLQLVGVPTSTQGYRVIVSKSGHSSERTYRVGEVGNPNPVKPDATIALQSTTNLSFAIDRVSTLNARSTDEFCAPVASASVTLAGSKLIGLPDVLKFPATTTVTDASGLKAFSGLEWDTYSLSASKASYDFAGSTLLTPFLLNPSSTLDVRLVFRPASSRSVLVAVRDAVTGQGVTDATVTLSRPGFSEIRVTGRTMWNETDWSGGTHSDASPLLDFASLPGSLRLTANASGTYPLATQWLESRTVDLGGSAVLRDWQWTGDTPAQAGPDSIKFQLASSDDGFSWVYTGPDGTPGTYYTASNFTPHSSLNGKRYLRYKVFLSTVDENHTPRLDSVSLTFSGTCVPPFETLYQGLASQVFEVSATASGYSFSTSSVDLSAGSAQVVINLNSL